jgi:hypothetical protein
VAKCRSPRNRVFSVAYSPADGAAYAGCEPSALWARRNGDWEELSALRELPSAPTWSFPPRPWTSHVRWIAPSPHDADVVLAGIELGGLMRTSDGGATWEDHRPGAQRDVHSLAWHRTEHGRAYEAAGGCSAWSRDNGETWEPADAGRRWRGSGPWEELDLGLERPLDTMPYALASTDDSLVMALRDGRLFGSDDQGDSWRPLETGGLTKVVAMAA